MPRWAWGFTAMVRSVAYRRRGFSAIELMNFLALAAILSAIGHVRARALCPPRQDGGGHGVVTRLATGAADFYNRSDANQPAGASPQAVPRDAALPCRARARRCRRIRSTCAESGTRATPPIGPSARGATSAFRSFSRSATSTRSSRRARAAARRPSSPRRATSTATGRARQYSLVVAPDEALTRPGRDGDDAAGSGGVRCAASPPSSSPSASRSSARSRRSRSRRSSSELHASRFVEPTDGLAQIGEASVAYAETQRPLPRFGAADPRDAAARKEGGRPAGHVGRSDLEGARASGPPRRARRTRTRSLRAPAGDAFVAQARGDLDGDGVLSTFEIRGSVAGRKAELVPGMYVESELE